MKAKKILTACLALAMTASVFSLTACDALDSIKNLFGTENSVETSGGEESGSNKTENSSTGGNGGNGEATTYTITFMVDGDVYETFTGERNDVIEAPETDPVKEGYTFTGWSGFTEGAKIKGNKTYTAQFVKEMNGLPTATTFQTPGSASLTDHTVGVYEAKKTTATIEVDGVLDDAYLDATPIAIDVAAENSGTATGFAYVMWDASYLYIHVTVNDANPSAYVSGDRWRSDSVELVLDTYNKATKKGDKMGDGYRGNDWCGEGQFRINAGDASIASGMHWMWDNTDIEKKGASRIVEGEGYTAEYKIAWGTFGPAAANKQVAFALLINDGANGTRKGVMAMESAQISAFDTAGVLSKLNLVD